MVQRVYKNGLPFSSKLDLFLQKSQGRVDNHKAVMIIIDGGLGEGKTTLMIHILDYINKINNLPPVEIDGPQLAMGGIDFLKKMRVCFETKLPCIGYDEAGDFSRRGSLTQFNAMLNRTFETFRAFKCIVVIVLPAFWVLDHELIDKNIPRALLHLSSRNNKWGNYKGYSLNGIQLLKYRMGKMSVKNYAYSTVWPNFYGHFLDLDHDRSKELDKLSSKNKLEILRKSEVKIEGLLTAAELATKLFKSLTWVYTGIKNLKLKPARKIGSVRYFDISTLNELSELLDTVSERPKK